MVCIAAFIILCILSIFVAILSIFRRDLGKKYFKVFKKSWGCVGKKLTLQKCETNFKEDIKNSILKKVVVKRPHLVKPISVAIEVAAVLIVVITIWSLVTAVKSGLSLWALGTCDIVQISSSQSVVGSLIGARSFRLFLTSFVLGMRRSSTLLQSLLLATTARSTLRLPLISLTQGV